MGALAIAVFAASWHATAGQLAGTLTAESPPQVDVAHCTKAGGCQLHRTNATLDANWRWVHGDGYKNCYSGTGWDASLCPDPESCAENCALEGVTAEQYIDTYGVHTIQGGLELKYITDQNAGSRLYLTEGGGERYKLFKLKNREFAFDVDVSTLPCGLNGAVYFSEMEATGGMGGRNKAGAKFGTGYCDAQCPHDVKFMNGGANVLDWDSSTAHGKWGSCCAEMDIWEANREATAYTSHPCSITGPKTCSDSAECGDGADNRYKSVCDKDGCDFNPFRSGDKAFFGAGAEYTVDSSKPFTVVTQWITDSGTDEGDLTEIRRIYVQEGKVIASSAVSTPGRAEKDDSISDAFCDAQKEAFGDPNEHRTKGGLKAMGDALDRGVALVLSIWDDGATQMDWLDASTGDGSHLGDIRGPCKRGDGAPEKLRRTHRDASVKYTNFMFGELDSTYTAMPSVKHDVAGQQPAQPAPSSSLGAAHSQCGGKKWTGSTLCEAGCTCVALSGYFSLCMPPAGAETCGTSPVSMVAKMADASSAGKASIGRHGRLRARRENVLLQRLGKLTRNAVEDRSDYESDVAGDEL